MKTLACYNIKGGVGKTAAAVNLAYLAAQCGLRTLVWDLDPQAAATFYLRVKPKVKGSGKVLKGKRDLDDVIKGSDFPLLDLLPADFSYRNMDLRLEDAKKLVSNNVMLVAEGANRRGNGEKRQRFLEAAGGVIVDRCRLHELPALPPVPALAAGDAAAIAWNMSSMISLSSRV